MNDMLDPGDRVLATHATGSLYIEPDIVSGNWGDRVRYDVVTDPEKLLSMLQEHDIEYLLIYRVPPPLEIIYDDPDFLAAYGELHYDGSRASLYHLKIGIGE